MSAKYITGSASSPAELLDNVVAFLQQQGWQNIYFAPEALGKRAHLSKRGTVVNFRALAAESASMPSYDNTGSSNYANRTGLGMSVGTGFNQAVAWNAQPGVPVKVRGDYAPTDAVLGLLTAGIPFTYHLFDDGADNVVIVAEASTAGVFMHLGFGPAINKHGSWAGGAYFYGSSPATTYGSPSYVNTAPLAANTFVRADVDTSAGTWAGMYAQATARLLVSESSFQNGAAAYPGHAQLGGIGVSAMSGQANLLPLNILTARDGGGYSYLASLPNVYRCDAVGSGFAAGSTYSVGSDSYVLFPNFAVKRVG